MDGQYQNNISELPSLDNSRYESIFRVYNASDTPNNFFYYNITRGVKINADNLDPNYYYELTVDRDIPWTTLAYRLYGSIYLWWLIRLINPSSNNLFSVKSGSKLKVIKQEYVKQVLEAIATQLKI
jgi:hypothetical protein